MLSATVATIENREFPKIWSNCLDNAKIARLCTSRDLVQTLICIRKYSIPQAARLLIRNYVELKMHQDVSDVQGSVVYIPSHQSQERRAAADRSNESFMMGREIMQFSSRSLCTHCQIIYLVISTQ